MRPSYAFAASLALACTLAIASRPDHADHHAAKLTVQSKKYIDAELALLYRDHFGPRSPEVNKVYFLVILLASLLQSRCKKVVADLEKEHFGAQFFIGHGLAPPNVNLKDFKSTWNRYQEELRHFKANKSMHFGKQPVIVPSDVRELLAIRCDHDRGQCLYGELFDVVVEAMMVVASGHKKVDQKKVLYQVKAAMLMTVVKRFRIAEKIPGSAKNIKWLLSTVGIAPWSVGYVANQMMSAYKQGLIGQEVSNGSGNLEAAVAKKSPSRAPLIFIVAALIISLVLVIMFIKAGRRRQGGDRHRRGPPKRRDESTESNESPS